ncbi:DUF6804 family protein [Draconibacterium sediminis]|uniref:DUF6804 family protein n=1 Tax=Draconibacterium sediminis TaxID=1544798 RepID=UPI0006988A4B|nr:DUF6804 family protein [Draconibacterium sediminis]
MKWLLAFCAIILFVGIANLPIGYYTFLRITTITGAIAVILTEYEKGINLWLVSFAVVGILFNPLVPIYLHSKDAWMVLDLIGGFLFLGKLIDLMRNNRKNE